MQLDSTNVLGSHRTTATSWKEGRKYITETPKWAKTYRREDLGEDRRKKNTKTAHTQKTDNQRLPNSTHPAINQINYKDFSSYFKMKRRRAKT